MRRLIRLLAGVLLSGLLLAIVAGVAGEFFIELAREWGWYDSPSNKVVSAVTAFAAFVTDPLFIVTAAISAGFFGGLWLDWSLRRTGQSAPTSDTEKRDLAAALDNYYAEGVALRNAISPQITELSEYHVERQTLTDWSDRTLEVLNNDLVAVKEISDFRTLNLLSPEKRNRGQRPVQSLNQHLSDVWSEKLRRLKTVIDRLGR